MPHPDYQLFEYWRKKRNQRQYTDVQWDGSETATDLAEVLADLRNSIIDLRHVYDREKWEGNE